MEYLGYANGWSSTPEIVRQARANGWEIKDTVIGRCVHRYTCEKGDFYYDVDSSD